MGMDGRGGRVVMIVVRVVMAVKVVGMLMVTMKKIMKNEKTLKIQVEKYADDGRKKLMKIKQRND